MDRLETQGTKKIEGGITKGTIGFATGGAILSFVAASFVLQNGYGFITLAQDCAQNPACAEMFHTYTGQLMKLLIAAGGGALSGGAKLISNGISSLSIEPD